MESEERKSETENIGLELFKELGQNEKSYKSGIKTINIIGEIEGHIDVGSSKKATKYEHVIPMIIDVEESEDVKGVLLILNTLGGDVESGLAIAELISGISKPCVTFVLGGSHSIGVPLAVCGNYSFISSTATMMIHPIRTNGLVIGVWQSFEYFKKMQERITEFVIRHSHITEKKFNQLMLNTDELVSDVGSILIGKQAVDIGLINEVGTLSSAREKLLELIEIKEKQKIKEEKEGLKNK